MRRGATPTYLRERNGGTVNAVLLQHMSLDQVRAANASWQPYIQAWRTRRWREPGFMSQASEHLHWDWARKAEYHVGESSCRILGIEYSGAVQGMMLVSLAGKRCRAPEVWGLELLYVDYLAAAPWNLPFLGDAQQFVGVGTALLFAAVSLSYEQGFSGRLGLHSLPQADEFYRRRGLRDFGPDADYQNLRYFELSSDQAVNFRQQENPP